MNLKTAISKCVGILHQRRSTVAYSSQMDPANSDLVQRIDDKFYSSEVTNVRRAAATLRTISTLPGVTK